MNPRDMFRLRGTGQHRYDFGAPLVQTLEPLITRRAVRGSPAARELPHRPHEAQCGVRAMSARSAVKLCAAILLAIGLYSLAPIHVGNPVPGLMKTLNQAQSAAKGWR